MLESIIMHDLFSFSLSEECVSPAINPLSMKGRTGLISAKIVNWFLGFPFRKPYVIIRGMCI